MNSTETDFCKKVRTNGYSVTKRGYPDFLVYRLVYNVIEYCFIEIKRSPDTTSRRQKDMITLFTLLGLPVQIIKDDQKINYAIFQTTPQKQFKSVRKKLFRLGILPHIDKTWKHPTIRKRKYI